MSHGQPNSLVWSADGLFMAIFWVLKSTASPRSLTVSSCLQPPNHHNPYSNFFELQRVRVRSSYVKMSQAILAGNEWPFLDLFWFPPDQYYIVGNQLKTCPCKKCERKKYHWTTFWRGKCLRQKLWCYVEPLTKCGLNPNQKNGMKTSWSRWKHRSDRGKCWQGRKGRNCLKVAAESWILGVLGKWCYLWLVAGPSELKDFFFFFARGFKG